MSQSNVIRLADRKPASPLEKIERRLERIEQLLAELRQLTNQEKEI
jgi:hypothetical protein